MKINTCFSISDSMNLYSIWNEISFVIYGLMETIDLFRNVQSTNHFVDYEYLIKMLCIRF